MNTPPKYPPPVDIPRRRIAWLAVGGAAVWASGILTALAATGAL